MPVCAVSRMIAILVDQHRDRQIARGRTCGQKLAKRSAILIVQRPGMGDVVGHSQNVATNKLRVFLHIGARNAQRVLDHLARRARKQPIEAAIDGHVGDDRHQHRRQHRDDGKQADNLNVQPRRRPAAAAGLHHLPDFADDDADQHQDGRRIDQHERNDDFAGRLDRVRPVSTTKVRKVDSSARPTANGASNLRRRPPLGSANDGSNVGAEVSALVIPAKGELKGLPLAGSTPAAD